MSIKTRNLFAFFILIVLIFSLCGCDNENKDGESNKKAKVQIEYMDNKIISMLNKLNNIELKNYMVTTNEVSSKKSKEQGSGGESGSSGNGQSQEMLPNEGEASSGQGGSSGSGEGGAGGNSKTITASEMQPNNILVTDRNNIDWVSLKSELESFYVSWDAIILDLYEVGIDHNMILEFSDLLDATIVSFKNQNKQLSLDNLSKLYSYIPRFSKSLGLENLENATYQTKSNIINAYAIIDNKQWGEVQNQINQALYAYEGIVNDVEKNGSKQESVSKIYLLINELKNSLANEDADIFYIKYKNIIEYMNMS